MKHRTWKAKWLIAALFVLLMVAVVGLSHTRAACAFGFCETCTGDCYQEGGQIYLQCRTNGGTIEQCDAQEKQYYCSCTSLFCSGCGPQPRCDAN